VGSINRSFFGDAATRLYRFLGVSGQLSPQFVADPQLVCVLNVGDATDPGYNASQNRGWAWANQVAAAGRVGLRATADGQGIIIDGFSVRVRVAVGRVWARVMEPPAAASVYPGLTSPNVTSTERKLTAGGEVPLAAGIVAPGGVAAPIDTQWVAELATGMAAWVVPTRIYLPPLSAFEICTVGATTELDVSVWGRVF